MGEPKGSETFLRKAGRELRQYPTVGESHLIVLTGMGLSLSVGTMPIPAILRDVY